MAADEDRCISLTYLRKNIGFLLSIRLNERNVFSHEISLANPPPLCFPIPKIKIVKACIELYNINYRQKSLCVRIVGRVKLWIKKFSFVRVNFGCFRVRSLTKDQFVQLAEIASSQNLTSTPTGNWPSMIDDNDEETELSELIRLLRGMFAASPDLIQGPDPKSRRDLSLLSSIPFDDNDDDDNDDDDDDDNNDDEDNNDDDDDDDGNVDDDDEYDDEKGEEEEEAEKDD
ncbi:hypothetical protein DPMN_013488 [Dreissena polymorpha]|uniref:DUF4773 domain-containing protein n=1 Tax=Dreissena polymorpha TaxID=45954 RepID=A0A9D4N918_DREPO|nr:hypothetical protein DPMN_013488 [Dreissena polymorpha]